jgi:hypothetical protein
MKISMATHRLAAAVLIFATMPALCADWNPRLAAQYLDSRQKQWFAWPPAAASGVTCVSCHTGLPYLLARPALRLALGETEPTLYEAVLLDGLRATIVKTEAKDLFPGVQGRLADQVYGAQVVLSTLLLAFDDAPRGRLTPETEKDSSGCGPRKSAMEGPKAHGTGRTSTSIHGRPRTPHITEPRSQRWPRESLRLIIKLALRFVRMSPLLCLTCATHSWPSHFTTG